MKDPVQVYAVTLCVIDHDRIGELDIRLRLADGLFASIIGMKRKVVDWTDDHPLNFEKTEKQAFRKLFGDKPADAGEDTDD